MAEEENLNVKFTFGEKENEGEINEGFVLSDEDENETETTCGPEDDRESDYYSGSPVDSLKNAGDETEENPNSRKDHKNRTITMSSLKSKLSQKSIISLGNQKWHASFS